MQLSEHFTLEELVHSDTAVRLGIDNAPPPDIVAHLKILAKGLERIRRVLKRPMTIKSGYRCEQLEKKLCEKDFVGWCSRHGEDKATAWPKYFQGKAHPQGYAADFICPPFGSPLEIVRAVKGAHLKFDQLIEEGTWVHVSFHPQMRGNILTAHFASDGTPSYSTGAA